MGADDNTYTQSRARYKYTYMYAMFDICVLVLFESFDLFTKLTSRSKSVRRMISKKERKKLAQGFVKSEQ